MTGGTVKHRTVGQVMTTDVVSVDRNMPFKDIVMLLAERHVSAVPVVDGLNHVLGVVSEADLLDKEGRPWLGHGGMRVRRMRRKARAIRAAELMTAPAITVRPDSDVVQAAALLARQGIKRLPVVDEDGTLVGIVSRRDLLSVFLRSGTEIREEIREEILARALCIDPTTVNVDIIDGVVILRGTLERKSLVPLVIELVRRVDGVVDVISHLEFKLDDTHIRAAEPMNVGIMRDVWEHRR